MTPTKLYVYDKVDEPDPDHADDRFDPGEVVVLAVGSVQQLQDGLGRLVKDGFTFNRALFETHGYPGVIKFANESLWHYLLDRDFAGRGYEKLFPSRAKIYFDGCNVAGENMGWEFLVSAGQLFLKSQGGITVGWASYGYNFSSWVPLIGGHTVHFGGSLRFVEFKPGGVETSRYDADDAQNLQELMVAQKKLNSF